MIKAKEYLNLGYSTLAKKKFAESVDVTPDLAYAFIQILKD